MDYTSLWLKSEHTTLNFLVGTIFYALGIYYCAGIYEVPVRDSSSLFFIQTFILLILFFFIFKFLIPVFYIHTHAHTIDNILNSSSSPQFNKARRWGTEEVCIRSRSTSPLPLLANSTGHSYFEDSGLSRRTSLHDYNISIMVEARFTSQ